MSSNDEQMVNSRNGEARKPWKSAMHRERRGKNLAFLAVLVGLILLFYFGYMARMGGL